MKKNIGLVINTLRGSSQSLLFQGITDIAAKCNCSIFVFPGMELNTPELFYRPNNVIYKFIKLARLDGIILASGTVCNFLDIESYKHFLSEIIDKTPVLNLNISIPGYPSILTDNRSGLQKAIRHIYETHHRRKFIYISGPQHNLEAKERYNAFMEVARELEITLTEDSIYEGNFTYESGVEAITKILDKKIDFDAIVTANDDMAIAVMDQLLQQDDISMEKISILGFDNVECAEFYKIPLTTVNHPIYEMGKLAVETILKIIDRRTIPDIITLPALPIYRKSCGCHKNINISSMRYNNDSPIPLHSYSIDNKLFIDKYTEIIKDSIKGKNETFSFFNDNAELEKAQHNILLENILDSLGNLGSFDAIGYVIALRNVLSERKFRIQSIEKAEIINYAYNLDRIINKIYLSDTIEQLESVISSEFPRLKIMSGMIALYAKPIKVVDVLTFKPPRKATICTAFDNSGIIYKLKNKNIYLHNRIIPITFNTKTKATKLIFKPFYFKNIHYGYMVFQIESHNHLQDVLFSSLGTVIKIILDNSR
jgi:DNA-binding LacI/PurR family transcriptional regulator